MLFNSAKKIFYLFANPIKKLYWFIFRPRRKGVKIIVQHDGKILFVRLGYAHKSWTIHGGGVKRNESFEEAAKRETYEEVGIKLENIEKIGEYLNTREYKVDTVQCFKATVDSPHFKIDNFEIVEARWELPDSPPRPYKPRVEMLVDLLKKSKQNQ